MDENLVLSYDAHKRLSRIIKEPYYIFLPHLLLMTHQHENYYRDLQQAGLVSVEDVGRDGDIVLYVSATERGKFLLEQLELLHETFSQ